MIARQLPAENAQEDVLCRDGRKRHLWETSYSIVSKFFRNRKFANLKFEVFYREGRYGPVVSWPFAEKRRRSAKVAAIKEKMENLFRKNFASQT